MLLHHCLLREVRVQKIKQQQKQQKPCLIQTVLQTFYKNYKFFFIESITALKMLDFELEIIRRRLLIDYSSIYEIIKLSTSI